MASAYLDNERLAELLSLRTVEGLSARERMELHGLSQQHADYDDDALDRAAAALALAGTRLEPMPAALQAAVMRCADDYFGPAVAGTAPVAPRSGGGTSGWFAAAAALLLAAAGWWHAGRISEETAALVERQAALEAEAAATRAILEALARPASGSPDAAAMARLAAMPGTISLQWSTTDPPDPVAAGSAGSLVWNPGEQLGFMRFRNLAPNRPAESQYQLWIFDAQRDERFPVDGGVFDISPGTGDVIVPIRAKLPVWDASLFAVTVEQAGGVVVSSRERIALLARPVP